MIRRILMILLLLPSCWCWSSPAIRLAADEWPPFTGKEGERHIAQDLVAMALGRAGMQVSVSIGPWERAVAAVLDGRVDGLVAVWRTSRRETLLLFSRPMLENRIHAVTLNDSGIKVRRIENLRNRAVAKTAGYAYGDALDSAEVGRLVPVTSDREGLAKLLSKQCDVLLIDELSLRFLMAELSAEQRQQIAVQARLASRTLHFALLRQEARSIDVIRAFDTVIGEMMTDGTYNRVLNLPWLMVDSDGDQVVEMVPGPGALELDEPPEHDTYTLVGSESSAPESKRRVYLVGGRQYEDWGEARRAIIDDAQTERYDPMIQQTPYEIGVPF